MKRFSLAIAFLLVAVASVSSAADTLPNRLSYAAVGEWVSYSLPDGYIQKLTVADRTGDGPEASVEVVVENIYEGEVIEAKRISHVAGDRTTTPGTSAKPGVVVAIRSDCAEVNGKQIPVSVVEVMKDASDPENATTTEWWTSGEIPVFGIVKKVVDGETVWALAGFGES